MYVNIYRILLTCVSVKWRFADSKIQCDFTPAKGSTAPLNQVCITCVCIYRNTHTIFTDGLYTKGTRAHSNRELIRTWL